MWGIENEEIRLALCGCSFKNRSEQVGGFTYTFQIYFPGVFHELIVEYISGYVRASSDEVFPAVKTQWKISEHVFN